MSTGIIRAGLVGVTGYTGMELARLLAGHPHIRLTAATSRAEAGKRLGEIYPFLEGLPGSDVVIMEPEPTALAAACDIAFLAVPHGAAAETAAALLEQGLKVVDLSADFRLHEASVYTEWYGLEHAHPELLAEAVYGVPELRGEAVARARLVANPGCYPTSVILGLAPALRADLVETDDIVVDSKSGTTGAGRKAAVPSLFCEVADSFRAYNLGKHRHTPEIEQELSLLAGKPVRVSFNPHLVPMNRGILSTVYTRLKKGVTPDDVQQQYREFQKEHPWVRVLPKGRLPETRYVRGTMYCDIAPVVDPRTGRLIVVSVIDNICRGASGQAVANANLMLGLPPTEGLMLAPLMP